jgi:ABC-2 type transport system ATP-binding protein
MIQTQGLTKRYAKVVALKDLDLEIDEKTIFGLVGPNGAGKTTLIRILCGLLAPTEGRASVAGIDVGRHPSQLGEVVGYMPDYLIPYEGMRVWEYLDFFGAAYRIRRAARRARIDEILDLTGTGAMRDYYVETLSRGMSQRVGIARALIHDPPVLVLDEPTGGLDPRARVEIRLLLLELKRLGKTLIVSSHLLPELAAVCDAVGFLDRGALIACGSVREVARKVHPHRVFELQVLDRPLEAEQETRRLIPPERLSRVDRLDKLIRVELEGSDEDVSRILSELIHRGHCVIGFREVEYNLEEAFLALTSGNGFGRRSGEAP